MAKGPGPALLLAAVAALFLLKGKKGNGGTVAPESDDPGSPGGEKEKPATGTPATPKAKTQEELEEEYDPEAEAQADTTNEKIIAEAQWKKWPAGSELSQLVANHNVIFASEDCEAALIGRDWSPVIEFEEKLYDPASYWRAFAEGVRPNEVVEDIGGSHVRWFTDRLFKNRNAIIECEVEVPRRTDYEQGVEFDNAWTAYLNESRALAYLNQQVYHLHVKEPMMAAWAEDDPEAYTDWQVVELAEWAVDKYPNESVTEQTDQAYFSWIEGDESAPDVLDPDNPEHENHIALWVQLNEAIKAL